MDNFQCFCQVNPRRGLLFRRQMPRAKNCLMQKSCLNISRAHDFSMILDDLWSTQIHVFLRFSEGGFIVLRGGYCFGVRVTCQLRGEF